MIFPPASSSSSSSSSNDDDNDGEDGKFMTFDVRLKKMVTTYFDNNNAEVIAVEDEQPDGTYSYGNLKYSFLGGICYGMGSTLMAGGNNHATSKPKGTASTLGRILVPGFLAFETHHLMSHFLYKGVFHEERPTRDSSFVRTDNSFGYFENFVNYELQIVAGATAGLSYSLATSLLQYKPKTRAMTSTHMLSFAALFGGYDVYSDVLSSVLLQIKQDQESSAATKTTTTTAPTPMTVALAGGCAGMTQAWIIDFRKIYMRAGGTSSNSSNSTLEFASDAAATRYATTTAAAETSEALLTRARMTRAFLPGAAAFSAYEWFGTLLRQ
ncbi:unnamed protein product [Cylindrotheca closterium]|uniref:Uncharacterized protein n=1 Tax=Cylindrotheca closterium TaxID=2856 RepID=A0AAD2FRZ1_9STRA|nr:unnamed protein product [Cylindrotheca closterium]